MKKIALWSTLIVFGFTLVIFSIVPLRSQIMEKAGIAVAETDLIWNHLKDAAVGDAQIKGLSANGLYAYDPVGALWNRTRGDTTNGLWVNVKSTVAGSVAGTKTPADGAANPTDAIPALTYNAVWNTASWDRMRGDLTNGVWSNIKASVELGVKTTQSSTIVANQVAIDSTAGGIVIKASNASRKSIIIRNQGANDMWIGPTATLTTATGLLIKASESVTLDRNTAAIYGICAAATTTTAGYLEE